MFVKLLGALGPFDYVLNSMSMRSIFNLFSLIPSTSLKNLNCMLCIMEKQEEDWRTAGASSTCGHLYIWLTCFKFGGPIILMSTLLHSVLNPHCISVTSSLSQPMFTTMCITPSPEIVLSDLEVTRSTNCAVVWMMKKAQPWGHTPSSDLVQGHRQHTHRLDMAVQSCYISSFWTLHYHVRHLRISWGLKELLQQS